MARLSRDGCEIHYEVTGSGSPVLLVHGLGIAHVGLGAAGP